ncbi:MAG TPA: HNH endonuclease signature motif containing protein, partial [Jatrophihabitans sp.]|nr:HNH endonuclease signature motif containing protein [Jatrophihabitans sp.]
VTNDTGAVLALGRTRRLATHKQRLALAARDGGCSFPGCTRPAAWCEAHHVIPWRLGGRTDLANLCLVCRFHHREFERRGWRVAVRDGHPEWIAPPWLDPDQQPRRNTAHHPPDSDFVR